MNDKGNLDFPWWKEKPFTLCVHAVCRFAWSHTYGLKGRFRDEGQPRETYRVTRFSAINRRPNGRILTGRAVVRGRRVGVTTRLSILLLWWPWKRSSWSEKKQKKHGLTGRVCAVYCDWPESPTHIAALLVSSGRSFFGLVISKFRMCYWQAFFEQDATLAPLQPVWDWQKRSICCVITDLNFLQCESRCCIWCCKNVPYFLIILYLLFLVCLYSYEKCDG